MFPKTLHFAASLGKCWCALLTVVKDLSRKRRASDEIVHICEFDSSGSLCLIIRTVRPLPDLQLGDILISPL